MPPHESTGIPGTNNWTFPILEPTPVETEQDSGPEELDQTIEELVLNELDPAPTQDSELVRHQSSLDRAFAHVAVSQNREWRMELADIAMLNGDTDRAREIMNGANIEPSDINRLRPRSRLRTNRRNLTETPPAVANRVSKTGADFEKVMRKDYAKTKYTIVKGNDR